MNPRLLHHYNNELTHLRQTAGEFAKQFPKVAGRLMLDPDGKAVCPDPFVERLLEGVAFLTARVQLKFEAEFPRLTQSLLETVYPHFLAPTPSMLIARFEPEMNDPGLASGFPIPRHTTLRSELARGFSTPCEYRTAHDVTLWPIQLTGAQYLTREIAQLALPPSIKPAAVLRLSFELTAAVDLKALEMDRLPIYLRGAGELPFRLYENIYARCQGVFLQTGTGRSRKTVALGEEALAPVGFRADEALLPVGARSFEGYRLLSEYFHFPQRFLFAEVRGMRRAFQGWTGNAFDLVLVFNQVDPQLENRVDASAFELFCTPAVNLFEKRLDRIELSDRFHDYHVIPEKTHPLDFEVHTVTRVEGIGETQADTQPFTPFYFSYDRNPSAHAYYSIHRVQRELTERERLAARRNEPHTDYLGSDAYISLVDANHAPFRPDLKALSLSALCTNRHLPIALRTEIGKYRTDFHLDINAPISATRCIGGPTLPVSSLAEGDLAWRAISHLTLNYLSLTEGSDHDRAAALREILALYAGRADESLRRQLLGLRTVSSTPAVRRVLTPGPIGFARGLEVTLTFHEPEFSGVGLFLFGAVLEQFLAKYVSINSFTETVLRSDRGEIKRWRARPGLRNVL
jgi:type VI secretion system protein ImpG